MMTDRGDYLEFYDKTSDDARKESAHQIESFSFLTYRHPEWLAFHSKNEGRKTIATAVRDQQEGIVKGVSDLIILTGFQGCKYPFAAIELKRAKKNGTSVSKEQKEFLRRVREMGGFAAVCYGSDQVKEAIKYMCSQH